MRKLMRVGVFAGAAWLGTALLGDAHVEAANPPSYKIRCRGGDIALDYYLNMPNGSTTIKAEELLAKYEVRMRFGKSPVKGTDAIPEGTCAWMDRPFNANETPRFRWPKAPFPVQVSLYPAQHKYGTIKLGNIWDDASANMFRAYQDKLHKTTEYFFFWGYAQGDYIIITKVGP